MTDYATDVLYPYCSPEALQPDYRMGVVAREVLGYCPDIVCLQEMSTKWFENYLLPVLEEKGFKGTLAVKTGKVRQKLIIYVYSDWNNLYEYNNVSSCADFFANIQ